MLERLTTPHKLGSRDNCIDYSVGVNNVKKKIQKMEETQQTVDGICQQRENHWSLSIERYSIITNMTKVWKVLAACPHKMITLVLSPSVFLGFVFFIAS